jgi:glycosyltransferase involved in cell wall biosynthesis
MFQTMCVQPFIVLEVQCLNFYICRQFHDHSWSWYQMLGIYRCWKHLLTCVTWFTVSLIGGVADVLCKLSESILKQSAVRVGQYENFNLEFSKWVLKFLLFNLSVLVIVLYFLNDVEFHWNLAWLSQNNFIMTVTMTTMSMVAAAMMTSLWWWWWWWWRHHIHFYHDHHCHTAVIIIIIIIIIIIVTMITIVIITIIETVTAKLSRHLVK